MEPKFKEAVDMLRIQESAIHAKISSNLYTNIYSEKKMLEFDKQRRSLSAAINRLIIGEAYDEKVRDYLVELELMASAVSKHHQEKYLEIIKKCTQMFN